MLLTRAGFKSKKIRVMLNAPVKSESKAEVTDVLKTVDDDRKMLIQAIIVRSVARPRRYLADGSSVMKSRKQLKHQALVTATVEQLSPRFSPKISDIKKAIDSLLDREYIERVEGQRDLYSYVA